MKAILLGCTLLTMSLGFYGCNHKSEKEVTNKILQEKQINSVTDFILESDQAIDEAEGISDAQRAQLVVLRNNTLENLEVQEREDLKLRVILEKELLSSHYSRAKMNILKKKIKQASQKKVSILYHSIKEADQILGRPYQEGRDRLDFDHTIREHDFR